MSHQIPANLKYTKEHEWALIENETVSIGITDYAQSQLGDIVFVELPEVGQTLEKNGAFGVVESIKSVSDLYSPIAGEVIAINEALSDSPESCNSSPYDSWFIKIKASKPDDANDLLDAKKYESFCNEGQ